MVNLLSAVGCLLVQAAEMPDGDMLGRGGNPPAEVNRTMEGEDLPPGLYSAEPYAGLVLLPGAHPDDRMVIGGGSDPGGIKMPTIAPELRLVPKRTGER